MCESQGKCWRVEALCDRVEKLEARLETQKSRDKEIVEYNKQTVQFNQLADANNELIKENRELKAENQSLEKENAQLNELYGNAISERDRANFLWKEDHGRLTSTIGSLQANLAAEETRSHEFSTAYADERAKNNAAKVELERQRLGE